jgi:hypothetical protein
MVHHGASASGIGCVLAAVLAGAVQIAAQAPDDTPKRIVASPRFAQASAFIRSDVDRFVRELIALTEVPAPPFKEDRRGAAFLDLLRQVGLSDVERDAEGNVMGIRKGAGGGPLLAVVAHLDTVFPEGTPVTVKREGTKLMAPGVGDDTRGLALALAVIRAMDAARFETAGDILFVGSVGEEGRGNLRGVRHLMTQGKYTGRIRRFLAIDGGDQASVVRGGVGSKRYQIVFKGPGGHSYGAFGLVNPAYAMAAAISGLSAVAVPSRPKTTYNIGVVAGGTSVNAIPAEVRMDVDLRSESCEELQKLDRTLLTIVKQAADAGEPRAFDAGGTDSFRAAGGRGSSMRRDADGRTAPAHGDGCRPGVRTDGFLQLRQHRQQRPDESGHTRPHHRPWRTGRPRTFSRRMDGCRSEGSGAIRPDRAGDHLGRSWSGVGFARSHLAKTKRRRREPEDVVVGQK